MAQSSYSPNLGILSSFQGIGNAISDVGKMGLVDAMETRRSKMENELRMQLKGADQEFKVEQAGIEDERKIKASGVEDDRKVAAAKTKFGYDKELEGIKASGRAGSSNNKIAGREMLSPGGQPVAMDQVRKLYADANGLNQEMIEWENVEPDFNKWAEKSGFTWKGAKPAAPPQPKSEADFKAYYSNAFPDATDEEYQQDLARDRASGLIAPTAPAAVPKTALPNQAETQSAKMDPAEFNRLKRLADGGDREASVALYDYQQGYDKPGVMDVMAAGAGDGSSQFAGGAQQGKPGVLDQMKGETETKPLVQPWKDNKRKAKLESERKSLAKYKSKAPAANRRGRTPTVDKAVKQVKSALKKGNIKMVSKDNLRLALNNAAFVNNLDSDQIKALREYLDQ